MDAMWVKKERRAAGIMRQMDLALKMGLGREVIVAWELGYLEITENDARRVREAIAAIKSETQNKEEVCTT